MNTNKEQITPTFIETQPPETCCICYELEPMCQIQICCKRCNEGRVCKTCYMRLVDGLSLPEHSALLCPICGFQDFNFNISFLFNIILYEGILITEKEFDLPVIKLISKTFDDFLPHI